MKVATKNKKSEKIRKPKPIKEASVNTDVSKAKNTLNKLSGLEPKLDSSKDLSCENYDKRWHSTKTPYKHATREEFALASKLRGVDIRALVLPGTGWTSEALLLERGVNVSHVLGIENSLDFIEEVYDNIPNGLKNKSEVVLGELVDVLQGRIKLKNKNFNTFWFDLFSPYCHKSSFELTTSIANSDLYQEALEKEGKFSLFFTVSCEGSEVHKNDTKFIMDLYEENKESLPAIPLYSGAKKGQLVRAYKRAGGIYCHIKQTFEEKGLYVEPTHSIYYRDGQCMYFCGFTISKKKPKNSKAIEPVFYGLNRGFNKLPATVAWREHAKKNGVIKEISGADALRLYMGDMFTKLGIQNRNEILSILNS